MGPENTPELVSSNSFRVDHRAEMTSNEMTNDIKSYLYEFRLQAQKYDYDLSLSFHDAGWKLGDPIRHEPMAMKAYRALMERRLRGEPTHREEAEYTGISFLEQQLGEAQIGDSLIWFSPPGPASEEYGDYGFGFTGNIVAESKTGKVVKMTANRFERPTLEQYREAFRLLIGSEFNAQTADDFIRMPVVVKGGLSKEYIELVFANVFGFIYDREEAERNNYIYDTKIKYLAKEYSIKFPFMSPSERITSIHAMENITIEAKKAPRGEILVFEERSQSLAEARESHGRYEPEEVRGSCPVTKSNNPLESIIEGSELGIDYEFKDFGSCKTCRGEAMLGPCGICRPCDVSMRKRQALGLAA